jgi:hypothetical protein
MKCAMLFALVVAAAAAATQAPVISLDLPSKTSSVRPTTSHKSKTLGLAVNNKNVGATRTVIYVARCSAGADQPFKTCVLPMPRANAHDCNDQKVKVTKSMWRVYLVVGR